MELINRYVHAVGENLPPRQRQDIEAEIRSLIQDTLDNRSQTEERPVDEAMTVAILKEFGHPETMAASYQPQHYLIGPKLFPLFWFVVRIVLVVLCTVLLLVGLSEQVLIEGATLQNMPHILLQLLGNLFSAAISAFTSIVIVFAILERVLPKREEKMEDFDPRKLEAVPQDEERVRPIPTILETIFIACVIILFNFYPQVLTISFWQDGHWTGSYAIFSDTFFNYMPWITVLLTYEIVQGLLKLREGVVSITSRWLTVVSSVFTIVLGLMMISGPSILNTELLAIIPVQQEVFTQMFNLMPRGIIAIVVIVEGIELIPLLFKLMVKQPR